MFLVSLMPALKPTPMLKSTSSSWRSAGALASLPMFSEAEPRSRRSLCSLGQGEG